MRLENKVALLTGIGQGMGRATARLFAQEGAKTALSARGEERRKETESQIESLGGTAIVITGELYEKSKTEKSRNPAAVTPIDSCALVSLSHTPAGGYGS